MRRSAKSPSGSPGRAAFLLILLLSASPGVFSAGQREIPADYRGEITIAYTSSLNGNIEGCDCKDRPRAGLTKSAVLLRRLKDQGAILAEAGDFLDARRDVFLAHTLTEAFRYLEYDVICPGDQEFSNDLDGFLELKENLPFITGNLLIRTEDGFDYPCPSYAVFERAGLKIGVGALIDSSVFYFYPEKIKENIRILSPEQTAPKIVAEMKKQGAFPLILLYHGPAEKAADILRDNPDLLAVIVAHEQRLIEQRIGKSMILSPGQDGNRVGVLTITIKRAGSKTEIVLDNRFTLFSYYTDPDDPDILALAQDYAATMTGSLRRLKGE